jgi:glycosyltransferase involved in cell wall biosynthesis
VLDAVAAMGSKCRLACFGPPMSTTDRSAVEARGLSDQVRFCAGDDHDLAHIYRAASVLVYPSLFEGFGLPPLEAMAHGCPVVAARAGAMPEVLGDAAIFFDPADVDDLGSALTLVLADDDRVAALRAAGRARAATYTWQRTVAMTLDGYRATAR